MQQFGPRETHQRNVRSWAFGFGGPGFDVQHLVTQCEACDAALGDAAGGTGGVSAPPLGNTGGTMLTGAQR